MNKKRIVLAFALAVSAAWGTVCAQTPAAAGNPRRVTINTNYNVVNSVDFGREYLAYAGNNLNPVIATFVNGDGSVSVCSPDNDSRDVYVYEYTGDLAYIKTAQFQMEYDMFGAFTKDNEGNYYLFSGKKVEEDERNVENMALVKYDRLGNKLNTYRLIAGSDRLGTINPFRSGSCRMEISGTMLCVYFGKAGGGHQSTFGFIVDKNTFQRMDMRMPFSSHSFDQFILPVDGGFVIADKGDSSPARAFTFSRVGNRTILGKGAFRFPGNGNYIFSQSGGLAKTANGYIFAGTYEKTASASHIAHTDSRNVLVLTFDNGLNNFSEPVWITNYSDKGNENAVSPKIAALDKGRYLLMWELVSKDRAAYMTIVGESGSRLVPVSNAGDLRLNVSDALRYSEKTGNVYWAVNNGLREINIYAFNPDKPISVDRNTAAAGGGYGMYLGEFNADKTTVSQNDGFSIRPVLRPSCSYPGGQVGAALTDNNGRIVEVIGKKDYKAQEINSAVSVGELSSVIPGTVAPGQYKLRIVVRPEGGEWRVVTLSPRGVPTSIDFTVTAERGSPGGGHGLRLTGFNVDKTTVSHNEQFTVRPVLRTIHSDSAFPGGQVGVALTDAGGYIVAVIGTRNYREQGPGLSPSAVGAISSAVPNTVKPGTYQLRIVVRPTGGEWRVVTAAAGGTPAGIDFTVK